LPESWVVEATRVEVIAAALEVFIAAVVLASLGIFERDAATSHVSLALSGARSGISGSRFNWTCRDKVFVCANASFLVSEHPPPLDLLQFPTTPHVSCLTTHRAAASAYVLSNHPFCSASPRLYHALILHCAFRCKLKG
jgi:hypothetical protein